MIMRETILNILSGLRPEFDFNESSDFIEDGMLDSFDIVSLVSEIEENFGVVINGEDILPENFCSVEAIENTINKSKG